MQSSEFKYTLKDLPINQRPREKMLAAGVEVLNDAELLAILIQKGTRNQTALDVAYVLLSKFGSLASLQNVGIRELLKIHGIGFAKACQIKSAFELSKRLREEIPAFRIQISSAKDVYALMKNKFLLEKKEYFYILLLDIKNKLLKECMISQGTLTASIVHPREVFNAAIKESAASIILIHNHPSGDPKPSQEDIDITRQIRQAGQIMGIKVLDHVIVGHTTYFSFAETISD
jgi:DNA repair protein RadC